MSIRFDPCPCRSVSVRVKSRGGHFRRKKAPAASWLAATRACQIQGWPFSPKKSACGKLDSSNRACEVVKSGLCLAKSGPCHAVSSQVRVSPHPCRAVSSPIRVSPCRAVSCQIPACQRVRVMSAPPCISRIFCALPDDIVSSGFLLSISVGTQERSRMYGQSLHWRRNAY